MFPFPRFCTFNVAIRAIACGDEHSCFVTSTNISSIKLSLDDYLLYAMGKNHKGQLGIGDSSV